MGMHIHRQGHLAGQRGADAAGGSRSLKTKAPERGFPTPGGASIDTFFHFETKLAIGSLVQKLGGTVWFPRRGLPLAKRIEPLKGSPLAHTIRLGVPEFDAGGHCQPI